MLANQILPGARWCSFLSNQLLKIQNKPLSIKVAFAVVGIFACLAIAYACSIGLSSLRSRASAPERNQNSSEVLYFKQNGVRVPLSRAQYQAAIGTPGATWIQVQYPHGSWNDVQSVESHRGQFVLNLLPSIPDGAESVPYHQVLDNGTRIECQAKSVSDFYQERKRREWVSLIYFKVYTEKPS